MASRLHGLSDGPERLSLSAQSDHFAGRLLLGLMRNELAAVATTETEGEFPTEIPAPSLLVAFDLRNALPDTFSGRGGDRQGTVRRQSLGRSPRPHG
jgi:hypothetical protein